MIIFFKLFYVKYNKIVILYNNFGSDSTNCYCVIITDSGTIVYESKVEKWLVNYIMKKRFALCEIKAQIKLIQEWQVVCTHRPIFRQLIMARVSRDVISWCQRKKTTQTREALKNISTHFNCPRIYSILFYELFECFMNAVNLNRVVLSHTGYKVASSITSLFCFSS